MKHYEIALVLHPDLEIDLDNPLKKIEGVFADAKATVNKKDNWGKRKLAYRINGQDWGIFVFYQLELDPAAVNQIESNIKIADEVMRYLIVSLENQKRVTKPKSDSAKADTSKNETGKIETGQAAGNAESAETATTESTQTSQKGVSD